MEKHTEMQMHRYVTLAIAVAATLGGCQVRTIDEQANSTAAARPDSAATTAATAPATQGDPALNSAPMPDSAAGALPLDSTPALGGEPAAATPAADPSPTSAAPASAAPAPAAPAAPAPTASAPTTSGMRLEVDVKARKLYVYEGAARTATYPVAVGSAEWPTQTGSWTVKQVIFNPAWVPPDESWAEEREPKSPGAPDNPLGRAQLVYDPPRTVHGTNQPASVGKAVSHGSIRMTNATITRLARRVMESTGAGKNDAWYRAAAANRREKYVVDLPRPVPIRVY